MKKKWKISLQVHGQLSMENAVTGNWYSVVSLPAGRQVVSCRLSVVKVVMPAYCRCLLPLPIVAAYCPSSLFLRHLGIFFLARRINLIEDVEHPSFFFIGGLPENIYKLV